MSEVKIRLATKSDLPIIMDIEQTCFPQAEAATKEEFEERFQFFGDCFMVSLLDNQIVGFINGCATDKPCLPDKLYHNASLHLSQGEYQTVFGLDVLPQYQNQGIAATLMNAFIELSKQRGKKGMVLTCKNHLVHYYEKFGFVYQGQSLSSHGGAKWNDMLLEF